MERWASRETSRKSLERYSRRNVEEKCRGEMSRRNVEEKYRGEMSRRNVEEKPVVIVFLVLLWVIINNLLHDCGLNWLYVK